MVRVDSGRRLLNGTGTGGGFGVGRVLHGLGVRVNGGGFMRGRRPFSASSGAFRDASRFGDIKAVAGCEGGGFKVIPALQLVDGDAEAVGDANQGIALMGAVNGIAGGWR